MPLDGRCIFVNGTCCLKSLQNFSVQATNKIINHQPNMVRFRHFPIKQRVRFFSSSWNGCHSFDLTNKKVVFVSQADYVFCLRFAELLFSSLTFDKLFLFCSYSPQYGLQPRDDIDEYVYLVAWARGQLRINFTRIFKVFTKLAESQNYAQSKTFEFCRRASNR